MRGLLFIVLIGCFFVMPFSHAFAQTNILTNPGFESSLNGWVDLWGMSSDLNNDVFRSGEFSLSKYIGFVNDQDYWSQTYQEIAYNPGEPVYASVYLKTTFVPEATARAGMMLQFLGSDGAVLGGTIKARDLGGTNDWALLELNGATAPAGTVKARLSMYVWAAKGDDLSLEGEAYFDDALLAKESKSPAPQKTLLNPGFENGLVYWNELYGYPAFLSSVKHSGLLSAAKKIETVSERDYWSQVYQEVECRPRKKVNAFFYVKTAFAPRAKARAGLFIEFIDSKNRVIRKYVQLVGGAGGWKKLNIKVSSAPTGTAKVRFSGVVFAPMGDRYSLQGTAYFDDALLIIQ